MCHGRGPSVLKYTWLKILDTLRKRGDRMTAGELKTELDSRGFFVSEAELGDDLGKMHELGLVEADLLATTDGTAVLSLDEFSRVGATPAGLRKLAAIVKV
jgi:repressor of nif and glnA expression